MMMDIPLFVDICEIPSLYHHHDPFPLSYVLVYVSIIPHSLYVAVTDRNN